MKEFLMSTTLPFWLVFIIVAAAFGATLLHMKGGAKSRTLLLAAGGCMLAATVLEIAIYSVLGGNSLWWCTSDKYGFWAKLLRLPLRILPPSPPTTRRVASIISSNCR